MRVAVLASSQSSWYVRDLQRAAGDDHVLEVFAFSQLYSTIANQCSIGTGEVSLANYDLILVRTMPPGSLEQVVFRMDALLQLEADQVPVLNRPKAIEAAVDKFLALARLRDAGFEVPQTETSQTVDEAMAGFQRLGGDVVIKPLFGGEGRGITRIQDEAIALRTFKLLVQLGAVVYQQEFVEHEGFDIRILVVGEEVRGMRRSNKLDWRTNISRGAQAEAMDVTPQMMEQAQLAANAVGADLAGVDFLPTRDGRLLAIEVNAVPGWRALARAHNEDISKLVLDYCVKFSEK